MGRKLVWWTSLTFLALAAAQAGAQKRYEPPLRLGVPFPAAWKTMLEVLDREEWTLVKKDRGRGEIVTGYRDYMSGPLTAGHLDKIGVRPRLPDGEWVRVRYRYDLSVSLIRERQTTVTVDSDIQALKRDFLGREEWVEIDSTGPGGEAVADDLRTNPVRRRILPGQAPQGFPGAAPRRGGPRAREAARKLRGRTKRDAGAILAVRGNGRHGSARIKDILHDC